MKCNICKQFLENQPILSIKNPDRFEIAIGQKNNKNYLRTWHRCINCKVVQAAFAKGIKKKLQAISGNYYSIDFGEISSGNRYNKILSIPNQDSDNYYRVVRIMEFYKKWSKSKIDNNKILDIGGGLGVFMTKFLQLNENFSGYMIEPDVQSTMHINKSFPFKFYREYFIGQKKFQKKFDIITLNKVIEHIEKPQNLLKLIKSAINPISGILYIEVPDVLNIKYKSKSDNSLGSLHYNLYDFASLNYLINACGYFTLQMERIYEPSGKISIYAFAILKEAVPNWLNSKN